MPKVAPSGVGEDQRDGPTRQSCGSESEQAKWDDADRCNVKFVWKEFDQVSPDFFGDLCIAKDGGFSDVSLLFDPIRFPWAAFQVACLVLNLFFIIQPNVTYLLDTEVRDWGGDATITSRAMVLNNCWTLVFSKDRQPKPKIVLAWLELAMLAFYMCKALVTVCHIVRGNIERRWHGWAHLLWDIIPELSTFSAMKSLHFVTPKVLLTATIAAIKGTVKRRGERCGLPLLQFIAMRVFYAFVGFEAFVIKFNMASQSQSTATSFLGAAAAALAFLNQMLGVVDVNKFAHRRLFLFIFGGEDGFMSDREEMVAKTYLAMLAMHTYAACKAKKPRWLWFLVATLSYGDQDFQRLTLCNTEPIHRQKKVATSKDNKMIGKSYQVSDKDDEPI